MVCLMRSNEKSSGWRVFKFSPCQRVSKNVIGSSPTDCQIPKNATLLICSWPSAPRSSLVQPPQDQTQRQSGKLGDNRQHSKSLWYDSAWEANRQPPSLKVDTTVLLNEESTKGYHAVFVLQQLEMLQEGRWMIGSSSSLPHCPNKWVKMLNILDSENKLIKIPIFLALEGALYYKVHHH